MESLCSPWLRVALAVVILVLALSGPALAQDDEDKGPWYDVPVLPSSKPWIGWLIGFFLTLLCLAPAFKNPHRSHLD